MNEKELTTKLYQIYKPRFYVKSFEEDSPPGWPDLYLQDCDPGVLPTSIWIETKVVDNFNSTVSFGKNQVSTLNEIATANGIALVVIWVKQCQRVYTIRPTVLGLALLKLQPVWKSLENLTGFLLSEPEQIRKEAAYFAHNSKPYEPRSNSNETN